MTTELTYLTLSVLLTGTLWLPYVIGLATEQADYTDFSLPPDRSLLRPWVQRAFRAHQNALETTVPFAAVVLIAHVSQVSTALTAAATVAFFWIRLIHAVGMISGLAVFPIRPLLFSASYGCTVAIAVVLLLNLGA